MICISGRLFLSYFIPVRRMIVVIFGRHVILTNLRNHYFSMIFVKHIERGRIFGNAECSSFVADTANNLLTMILYSTKEQTFWSMMRGFYLSMNCKWQLEADIKLNMLILILLHIKNVSRGDIKMVLGSICHIVVTFMKEEPIFIYIEIDDD